jgi:CII-binding regulator of phage lambda lysogenization HflD
LKETLYKEKKHFEQEKIIIMKDLRHKKDLIAELTAKLQQSESSKERLEQSMGSEERDMKKKFMDYEKSID